MQIIVFIGLNGLNALRHDVVTYFYNILAVTSFNLPIWQYSDHNNKQAIAILIKVKLTKMPKRRYLFFVPDLYGLWLFNWRLSGLTL